MKLKKARRIEIEDCVDDDIVFVATNTGFYYLKHVLQHLQHAKFAKSSDWGFQLPFANCTLMVKTFSFEDKTRK